MLDQELNQKLDVFMNGVMDKVNNKERVILGSIMMELRNKNPELIKEVFDLWEGCYANQKRMAK